MNILNIGCEAAVETALTDAGMAVVTVPDGYEGADLARNYDYDLITLAGELPDMPGETALRQIRAAGVTVPVIVIGTETTVQARVLALTIGADDYILSPWSPDELVARVQAIARRSRGLSSNVVTVGPMSLDIGQRTLTINGERVHLTGKEFDLLQLLMVRRDVLVTKEAILDRLYGGRDEPEPKIVDVFVCKLRAKLRPSGADRHLRTVWGQGYSVTTEAGPSTTQVQGQTWLETRMASILKFLADEGSYVATATIVRQQDTRQPNVWNALRALLGLGYVRRTGDRKARSWAITETGIKRLLAHGWTAEERREAA